jgi:hypothetical protein
MSLCSTVFITVFKIIAQPEACLKYSMINLKYSIVSKWGG